ncbi:unnamed protein product [Rhizophagus irregularis]|nr:unnamed protein product [Rhizophagus irregularis]
MRLIKRHVWLTSWSKMRVDLAEQTLSKDVANAMKTIDELKEISTGKREFIHYLYFYRQIFHSKKPLEGLTDSRLQTLKNIHDWFIIRDKQKINKMNWISPQCQFDLLLSIQGFLGMIEEIFTLYPNSIIEPRRISQDMLEGLFVIIEQKRPKDNNIHITLLNHSTRLSNMSPFTRQIFESLLLDDLFMGKIEAPTSSFILFLQEERQQLFNLCLYNDKIASILNNYLCSGIWYLEFQKIILQNHSSAQRLVAYFLICKVIEQTFKGDFYENRNLQERADPNLTPKKIINLNQAEFQKFSYIIDWVLFKLLKRDHVMNSHPKFRLMHTLLEALCKKKVEYVVETKSQITNIIPGPEFTQFMHHLESLVIDLFEKHNELGSNILHYVKNSLLSNTPLNQMFITILKTSAEVELEDEEFGFIYERCITIYMRSHQKTWRDVNNYIPEKGTASLRESLKTMRSNNSPIENKKSSFMKKTNLPTNPAHALEQLRVWAQLEKAEDSFANIFSVSELLWIV